jgi:hypothetical protein
MTEAILGLRRALTALCSQLYCTTRMSKINPIVSVYNCSVSQTYEGPQYYKLEVEMRRFDSRASNTNRFGLRFTHEACWPC